MNDKAERQAARVWTEDAQTKIQQTTEYPAKTGKENILGDKSKI